MSVPDTPPAGVEVVILTQANCTLCDEAQSVLARLSREFALRIAPVNIGSPQGELLARDNGVLFAPGLLLDGALFSYGRLSERKLRRELSQRAAA